MDDLIYDLMEDSQFVDIMTYDILDEGEQADAYRARKEKEKADAEKADNERFDRRYSGIKNQGYVAHAKTQQNGDHNKRQEDIERDKRAGERLYREGRRRRYFDDHEGAKRIRDNAFEAGDAANRHERRHGSK